MSAHTIHAAPIRAKTDPISLQIPRRASAATIRSISKTVKISGDEPPSEVIVPIAVAPKARDEISAAMIDQRI
ncbi:hypothetical protein GCM10010869_15420 [Mesorhizobium tianshanense]|nr:hypothetical protein GCM10010869_15420 [Mesorhizobium tianshanense]